jgi:hypothetical protein
MGSGELTATMVEVHKELLAGLTGPPRPVFLDTPAGFQLNVDHLSERAAEYFRKHVQQDISIASFRSKETCTEFEAERAFYEIRRANFTLIGPGSPTYAVSQWQHTAIPDILIKQIELGGCLVAASAAALTLGRFTLPVYEIYKVGSDLHWVEGIDILDHFGFNLVVIPHWNNAEGGTHDTQCCFMGKSRFLELESLFAEDVCVLGIYEHTACLLDLEKEEAVIRGIGTARLRCHGTETLFEKGTRFPLDVLRGKQLEGKWQPKTGKTGSGVDRVSEPKYDDSFWNRVRALEASFREGLERHDAKEITGALLQLDQTVWQAKEDLEHDEFISQGREVLRDLIVVLGMRLGSLPKNRADCLDPLVERLLELREKFRQENQWKEADAVRDVLERAEIIVEDTPEGTRWQLKS